MSLRKDRHDHLAMAFLTGQSTPEELELHLDLYEKDAGYRERVKDIEVWLAPLNEDIEDRMPPSGVLDDIMQAIENDSPPDQSLSTPANDRKANLWKPLAIASSFIAMVAIGSHFLRPVPAPVDQTSPLMALLSGDGQTQLAAIIYNPETNKVVARFSNVTVPEENDLELWLIRKDTPAPVSLGILAGAKVGDTMEFELSIALADQTDTLAISLEPLGGSGTESGPKGPILFTGAVSQL